MALIIGRKALIRIKIIDSKNDIPSFRREKYLILDIKI